jgi:sigma-B regulation protein RsbU (phosphoserine phosphatase)
VVAAEDGQQAWEQYHAGDFDLVITDWEMPRVSGLELIQRIRHAAGAAYTYVIMLTGRSDKSDVVRGIEAGADDFVSKPFDRDELRVRLLAGVRIVTLERALNSQNAELRAANERIHSGLRAAARVQRSMLPHGNVATQQVRTAWTYVPTEELAGDALGLHLVDGRYLVAYVIDVSGHGVPAALLSVTAMQAMEPVPEGTSLLRDMSGAGGLGTVRRPGHVATEMNRRFRASDNGGLYLTMILGVLDTHTGQLCITTAGHPPAIVLQRTNVDTVDCAGGFPIAMFDDATYEEALIQLERGDRVLLYSDGVLEQTDPAAAEQFGKERLLALLKEQSGTGPEALVGQVVDSLSAWTKGAGFADDVSLVLIDWMGR